MNLLHLAPAIQEAILFLPRVTAGPDPIVERNVRPVAAQVRWDDQMALWRDLTAQARDGSGPIQDDAT